MVLMSVPAQSEASFVTKALTKARAAMQSAFQLSFLPNLPVVFHKKSFDQMFEHTHASIDNLNVEYQNQTISREQLQNDKATHIKKSAELALHIKSLIGSAHLAYGITMVVGLLKEAIDGSFLNPSGAREKEDVIADHVGAMAVFGKDRFDKSLQKQIPHLVTPGTIDEEAQATETESPAFAEHTSPFASDRLNIGFPGAGDASQRRQQQLKQYYEAVESGDEDLVKKLAEELKNY